MMKLPMCLEESKAPSAMRYLEEAPKESTIQRKPTPKLRSKERMQAFEERRSLHTKSFALSLKQHFLNTSLPDPSLDV